MLISCLFPALGNIVMVNILLLTQKSSIKAFFCCILLPNKCRFLCRFFFTLLIFAISPLYSCVLGYKCVWKVKALSVSDAVCRSVLCLTSETCIPTSCAGAQWEEWFNNPDSNLGWIKIHSGPDLSHGPLTGAEGQQKIVTLLWWIGFLMWPII